MGVLAGVGASAGAWRLATLPAASQCRSVLLLFSAEASHTLAPATAGDPAGAEPVWGSAAGTEVSSAPMGSSWSPGAGGCCC